MKLRSVIVGLAAFTASFALYQANALAASAENGRAAFLKHGCWQCHGYQGQGGVAGLKLAPNPIPFETLSNFVRTTNRAMPPFRKEILSDEDLADIYAYLQSIPKDPDPGSIPLLNP
jgi:ubiquinol-cytochrome c reductase cytochrome c subunit